MQFTIHKEALFKPLQRVAGAVERKQAQPILANILVMVKNQLLSLVATDLEVEMNARIPLSLPAEGGITTIPGRKLIDICKALPEQALITFECQDNKVIVRSGRSRYSIACLPAENFPKVEESPGDIELSVPQALFKQLLDATCFAMAHEDVRYYLNGIKIEFSAETLRMVATDGHRLATLALPGSFRLEQPFSVILPRKAVLEMQRLFAEGNEDIGLVVGKNHLRTITTQTSFITKLVSGKFPDYRRVLPASSEFQLSVPRELFRQALLRVSALFNDKYRGIGLQFSPGLLRILATTADKDEVEDELEIAYSGATLEIGVNASYLIEYLGIIQAERIKLSFTDPNHAILFEAEFSEQAQHSYVVMPMRL